MEHISRVDDGLCVRLTIAGHTVPDPTHEVDNRAHTKDRL